MQETASVVSVWAKFGGKHSLLYTMKPVDTRRKIDKHKCTNKRGAC